MPATNDPRQREIRVFISSTFRDMQEEREELVKQIFPQLRRLCESRGVIWGEVDLRWGIPDEAKAEGKVLPLCLAEIERCRPYFIGLLGERYGWVPEEVPAELLEAQPWLTKYRKVSVTALEILHGVLLNRDMAGHAFFYFRDPAYAALHAGFTEEDTGRLEGLAALKGDIRESGFPVADNFATPKQLGEWVLRDLTAVIEDLYPESSIPNPLDRAAADHEAYAASRRRVYIGRREYVERLDAHAANDGPPLVVLGESGGGKSALLANWTQRWSEQHPEAPVIVHFIGAARDSADWAVLLRRLLGEFQRHFGIQMDTPGEPDALRAAFANALSTVAARGRVVLVLDALNQIEDRDGAPDLVWLPPVIPANVRLVVSTLPGRPLEDLRKRAWPVLTVEPLKLAERQSLIDAYLKQFAKQLSRDRCHRIVAAPQSANGLYLATLVNELRLFGSNEELDERIGWYLEATNPIELYGKVIQRWERDYEEQGSGSEDIVGDSLSRVWAARRGLSEAELLESLGTPGSPRPHALWSPLYLAACDALVNRGGLLTFAHDFLREAVREAYLPTVGHEQGAHRTLAVYFGHQPAGLRQLDELPWQWQQAAEWPSLADLLANPGFFRALWLKDQFDVKTYWAGIETHSRLRMVHVYDQVIQQPARYPHAGHVQVLLSTAGKLEAALRMSAEMMNFSRGRGDGAGLSAALNSQANILGDRGEVDSAVALYKEQEHLCRERGDKHGLQVSLYNQATTLFGRGYPDRAMALYKEQESLCRELGNKEGLQASLGGQALILGRRGDLDGAMALCKQQEQLCRELGNKEGLQASLDGQAAILSVRGELDGAMVLYQEAEGFYRELGNKIRLQGILICRGEILKVRGDLDGAIALYQEAEGLCREMGSKDQLQATLSHLGDILKIRGDLNGAASLYQEAEGLCRESGNKDGLQAMLSGLGTILKARGDLDGAMAQYQEAEGLCRELGTKNGLQAALRGQAAILSSRGDLDRAMAMFKETERLCRELRDKDGLQVTLSGQGKILKARGDLGGAIALHKEAERLCRELGNNGGLSNSLSDQANILYLRGDLDGAMALYKGQERLCRELEDKDGLSSSLGNQANILYARGELDGAMALYKEQERLSRELGNKYVLQSCVGNQSAILYARRDQDGAMALLKEKERLCRELGDKDGLSYAVGNQANILASRRDADGALALFKEQEHLCRELGNPHGISISLANQAVLLSGIPQRRSEARRLADEALAIAGRHGYGQLVSGFQNLRDCISGSEPPGGHPEVNGGSVVGRADRTAARISQAWAGPSTPHPSANANRAQQMNLQYQEEKKNWEALPWWQRRRTPKPKPPAGI